MADWLIRYEPKESREDGKRVLKAPRGAILLRSLYPTEWAARRVWRDCKALIECEGQGQGQGQEMKKKVGAVVLYEDTYPEPREIARAEFSSAGQV